MEPLRSKDRVVLEAFAEFDPTKTSLCPPHEPVPRRLRRVRLPNPCVHRHRRRKDHLGLYESLFNRGGVDSAKGTEFLRSASVGGHLVESIHVISEVRGGPRAVGWVLVPAGLALQLVRKLGFFKYVTAVSRRILSSEGSSLGPFGDGVWTAEILSPGQEFFQRLGWSIRTKGIGPRVAKPQRGDNSCFIADCGSKKIGSDGGSSYMGALMWILIAVVFQYILGRSRASMAIAWLGNSIILGTSDDYTLFSISNGSSTPLFLLPESLGPPQLKSLWSSKEVLLLVDNVGVVVNSVGQPVGGSLIFQYAPRAASEPSYSQYHMQREVSVNALWQMMIREE